MKSDEINQEVEQEILSSEDQKVSERSSQRCHECVSVDSGFPFKTCPEPVGFAHLIPRVIRILILVDGGISFGNDGFGLSLLIDALNIRSPFTRFDITKASRNPFDNSADYPGFSFERDFNPQRFHEVWLLGSESDLRKKLPEKELRILAQFMNSGGGVFATGDHKAMGAALCGEVPRVRFMRKWFFDPPLPEGQPRAIPPDNEFRHDTTDRGVDCHYDYEDQTDDVPQMIFPKVYSRADTCSKPRPHEVLSHRGEPIRFLPDHLHEGECYVPNNLEWRFEFCGYEGEDFPVDPLKKQRRKPEVIAWAQIPEPHITRNTPLCYPVGQVPTFGVVGAYDGHGLGIGRVVVDSSFHHFINFNLCGFVKSQDKVSKDKGLQAYDQIKAYFRNIGVWLARRNTRREVFNRALAVALGTYPLIEEILSLRTAINDKNLGLKDYLTLGAAARSTIADLTSPGLASEGTGILLESLLPDSNRGLLQDNRDLAEVIDLLFGINAEVIQDCFLGGVVANLTRLLEDAGHSSFELSDTEFDERIAAGALEAPGMFSKLFNRYSAELGRLAGAFTTDRV